MNSTPEAKLSETVSIASWYLEKPIFLILVRILAAPGKHQANVESAKDHHRLSKRAAV